MLLAAACAATQPPRAVSVPACAESGAQPSLFQTLDARIPGTYRVDMTYDGGEWVPATLVGSPLHHATRVELVNLADFEPLPHDRPLTFVVELLDQEVREATTGAENAGARGGKSLRSTYRAKIVSICRTQELEPRRARTRAGESEAP